jgi:diacylglycerol kinase family enzyme
MWRHRLEALVALALGAAAVAMAAVLVVSDPLRAALRLLLLAGALAAAWQGLRRRGAWRLLGLGGGALLLAADITLLVTGRPLLMVCVVAALALAIVAGRQALAGHIALPPGSRPRHPVLFFNPRSGGGKSARYHLADEARARGIEPIELVPGADLAGLARQALDSGADALAMAGGDGSQATVAAIAAERRVPYACIPAGTRNHFALDLGVDRDDVVGALDALTDGGERVVDLAEVNGRVFVNNVSIGLYGQAVQRTTYRDAKIRTLLETVPDVLGPEAKPDIRWHGPDGAGHQGSVAIVVSNNLYRLEPAPGSGTRPHLDQGVLGVAVLGAPGREGKVRAWATPSFEVESQAPVPVGVDGEALVFDPPLRFRARPAALRCRIARHHPGASPAALVPERAWETLLALLGVAAGRAPRSAAKTK